MSDIDKALENFNKYREKFESYKQKDLSEEDTRSKIIDTILLQILSWTEDDIEREGYVNKGYYDYKLSIPGTSLILEAKKDFLEFELPKNHNTVSATALLKGCKSLIDQLRRYLPEAGTPFGIITNGRQFIIGKFINTDGTDWKRNKILIFNGFEDIHERFIDFYNNLSRNNVIKNGGFEFLLNQQVKKGEIVKSSFTDKENEISRNFLSSEIKPLIDHIFGEIYSGPDELDDELIKECFVENIEIKKNRSEIERIFEDMPPQLDNVIPARNVDSVTSQIEDEIGDQSKINKLLAPPKPIIIVGSKGAGKSTFIHYLFKQQLSKHTLKTHPYVYVDFRQYYNQDKTFDPKLIAKDILEGIYASNEKLQLHTRKVLNKIYYKDIKRNDESIWHYYKENNSDLYNEKISNFFEEKTNNHQLHLAYLSKYLISEQRKRILIVIDNADQYDMSVQEKVFLYANSLHKQTNCAVIISMREGYYYKWRYKPPFDAYDSNVYHISAPKYGEVLQKRIDYTLKKLNIGNKSKGELKQGYKIEFSNQEIIEFMSGLKKSFFNDLNSKIIDFMNYSTFPDIREGLRLFKMFLISGYTNVEEYILRERFSGDSQIPIPIHEFIKAIGLYNKLYYNHDFSIIVNLFYPCPNSCDHFLKCRILRYLLNKFEQGGNANKFEQYSVILNEFIEAGYNVKNIRLELLELLETDLIDSENIISDTDLKDIRLEGVNISISPKGYYYYKILKNSFHYIDLILQDTLVFNPEHLSNIRDSFPDTTKEGKRSLKGRLKTVLNFMSYLKDEEKNESVNIITKYGSITEEIFNEGLKSDIEKIKKNIVERKD